MVERERGREGGEIKRAVRSERRRGERRRWEMREGGHLNHLHSKWFMFF